MRYFETFWGLELKAGTKGCGRFGWSKSLEKRVDGPRRHLLRSEKTFSFLNSTAGLNFINFLIFFYSVYFYYPLFIYLFIIIITLLLFFYLNFYLNEFKLRLNFVNSSIRIYFPPLIFPRFFSSLYYL